MEGGANLNERSTLSMRSTASVWTDANDTWSQQPLSKADLAEELRYEEEASILADRAHASKLSRRRRCISNVNMRTMRGRVPPKPRAAADLTYDTGRAYALMRPNTSAGPEMRRGAQAVSGGCVLDTPELFAYEKLGLRGRAKRVARPEVVRKGHGPSTVDLPVPSLHMLSTKRRPLNYVSMKTNRGRQPMVPKPVSDACYAPKYSLTDKAVLCKFSVNARAPPRFGTTPTGSQNAFWPSNAGVIAINGARNGITPAIIRPECSPIKRWRR